MVVIIRDNRIFQLIRLITSMAIGPEIMAITNHIMRKGEIIIVLTYPEGTFIGIINNVMSYFTSTNILKSQNSISTFEKNTMINIDVLSMCPYPPLNNG